MSAETIQPPWNMPKPQRQPPQLMLNNSLTRKKSGGRQLTWYNCGPTVYDASHMGHARNYITFDIMRRVLEEYFNYEILYVMNITDIDDKIILRARQNYLLDRFKAQNQQLSADLLGQCKVAWEEFVQRKLLNSPILADFQLEELSKDFEKFSSKVVESENQLLEADEKFSMNWKSIKSLKEAMDKAHSEFDKLKNSFEFLKEFYEASDDILALYLDKRFHHEVEDKDIFTKLARYWENEFNNDMKRLNVRPADAVTRVTEFVPEVIAYIEQIMKRGYAYESDGSVYFDIASFKKTHNYAKLSPWSAGHVKLVHEGEGSIGATLGGKKSELDFALWKASKAGEPTWDSPWGKGRPGWHIECSVMASHIAGNLLDIHSGGIDLCFPHHDNEIAQAEAYYGHQQWVNFFFHSGHLHIEGQKMSKSLKNFITIREALEKYTAAQIRIMFLLHSWDSVLDYKDSSMQEAVNTETKIKNFLENVKALKRSQQAAPIEVLDEHGELRHQYNQRELNLIQLVMAKKTKVHEALCDNMNTPVVMQELMDLINKSNSYQMDCEMEKQAPNLLVMEQVAKYVARMIRIFGVVESNTDDYGYSSASIQNGNSEDALLPYLNVLAKFRSNVRELARQKAEQSEVLKLCDKLRDFDLAELGVLLEDKDDKSWIKLMPPEEIKKLTAEKEAREAEKQRQKAEQKRVLQEKRLEKLNKGRVSPAEMFKTAEFSKWGDDGLPTHDKEGVELPKSRVKKLKKEQDAQKKLHDEFIDAKQKGEIQ